MFYLCICEEISGQSRKKLFRQKYAYFIIRSIDNMFAHFIYLCLWVSVLCVRCDSE